MGGGAGSANAATTNQTSVSTNTFTDSFNQSLTRVENLSDVGNVSLSIGQGQQMNPLVIIILAGFGLIAFMMIRKKAS